MIRVLAFFLASLSTVVLAAPTSVLVLGPCAAPLGAAQRSGAEVYLVERVEVGDATVAYIHDGMRENTPLLPKDRAAAERAAANVALGTAYYLVVMHESGKDTLLVMHSDGVDCWSERFFSQ